MVPLVVLVISFLILRGLGWVGVAALNDVNLPLRIALCLMFLLTASAHWGKGRVDLIRMVPPMFPKAGLIVSVTGCLEILGAIGLVIPLTARLAAVCLAILLVALFPANVRAARMRLTILGRPVPSLIPRTVIQVIFISALIVVASRVH